MYPDYEIYLATDDGKILKKLTDAPGYDAEGTVNWKTGKIVYTSLASGDLDLWTMNTDGSEKKQITRRRATTAARYFRATERRWCGAPIIRIRRRSWRAIARC